MQFFKFKWVLAFIFIFSLCAVQAEQIFSDLDCVKSSFDASVSHKAFPFGLSQRKIHIEKKDCVIIVEHEKLKFIKKHWEIDVCRGPVHIKEGLGAVEVLRREGVCKARENDFCSEFADIQKYIQDDGLIFAAGEKEDLSSDHGKLYCSFILISQYLGDGTVFSRHRMPDKNLNLLNNNQSNPENHNEQIPATSNSKDAGGMSDF